ncbi:ABC transporter substrate binding protein [Variovorax saccharolyticus]|uniref:ABC transporter substrate binding protein n=1 Tax=Variovorax saccharolyticus TaxID=3053516 RepID=UPI002577DB06|nr:MULTISPECIES: ABC transporter substrate binding protein [unclassified Variovorax]MDM0019682.1 ABC transporter substrate binding protein [Variovorax sp. J22R187]MDM0027834.1 ABC transporter substrate binding protein [Variovorax sp. J31P216]
MLANRFPPLPRWQRVLSTLACAAWLCGSAQAAGLTVLMADETAAHTEFVRQLRETQDAGNRFHLVHLAAGERAVEEAAGSAAPDGITMAVGMSAARSAIASPGQDPLVLAMLSRLDYESLRGTAALRRPERQIGVLLREPAMADQLALIDAVMPTKRRLGIVATAESEPIVNELLRAGLGWDLQVEYAPDAKSLATALRLLVPRSDALLVLPDKIGDSQAATLTVLRAGAGAGLPVFGTSDGLVRSGGLAAAVSTPSQLAQQARGLGHKLAAAGSAPGVRIEAATPATVRVNATVARGLGLRLPDERELTARVSSIR